MDEGHPWNYFHNIVERDIRSRKSYMYPGELTLTVKSWVDLTELNKVLTGFSAKKVTAGKRFRIDLIEQGGFSPQIWDIKPVSYEIFPAIRLKGINQLKKYTAVAPYSENLLDVTALTIGDNRDISGQIPNADGGGDPVDQEKLMERGYTVKYWNSGEGLVVYHFEKTQRAWQRQEQQQEQEQEQKVPVPYEESRSFDEQELRETGMQYAREHGYNTDEVKDRLLEEIDPSIRDQVEEKIDNHINGWAFLEAAEKSV